MTYTLEIWIKSVVDRLSKETVDEILDDFIDNGFSKDKAKLISRFICKK